MDGGTADHAGAVICRHCRNPSHHRGSGVTQVQFLLPTVRFRRQLIILYISDAYTGFLEAARHRCRPERTVTSDVHRAFARQYPVSY
jgi:hypothetical protein